MLQTDRVTDKKRTVKKTANQLDRQTFMHLTITERRRILKEQAKKILACYLDNSETSGMGGGDFIGC